MSGHVRLRQVTRASLLNLFLSSGFPKDTVNPRTDGGLGHLSTDGGGADNRPQGDLKNEASYRQAVNGIGYGRASSTIFTQVVFRSGQKWRPRGKKQKMKMAALESKGVFANNFWTNWVRAKLSAPSRSSRWYASKYVYHDLIRLRLRGDLRSRLP